MDAQVDSSSTRFLNQDSNESSRAAYFGQELLSTFGTSIGEIALIPATGGVFKVHVTYKPSGETTDSTPHEALIWDRKAEGGFPETKILKQRVRNLIEPEKNLGHSDTPSSKAKGGGDEEKTAAASIVQNVEAPVDATTTTVQNGGPADAAACEDCK